MDIIKPQPGPQETFLSTSADIAIYGGAAGGGKTFALLLEPMRHLSNKNFHAIIFRRTRVQVKQAGGLWAEAEKLYPAVGAVPNGQDLTWKFPSGMKVGFSYLATDADKYQYQGAQIPLIGFDELTHFKEDQFFYMLSRIRSDSGVRGYVRATTNPDPDSWVASFIDWWIDDEGYPIPERSGVIRWFIRRHDDLIWADTKEELIENFGDKVRPKSVTFIKAGLEDNKILMDKDPDYEANLQSLPYVERMQLLGGNWKIKPAAGLYFRRDQFKYCDKHELPKFKRIVRYWDRAATEKTATNDPDATAGVLMGIPEDFEAFPSYYVIDVVKFHKGPQGTLKSIMDTAAKDGKEVEIGIEQDPGQAGKVEAQYLAGQLRGYTTKIIPASGKKLARATPYSSQVQAGNVILVRDRSWNDDYIKELEAFDGSEKGHDDQVDGSSGAFNMLNEKKKRTFIGRA